MSYLINKFSSNRLVKRFVINAAESDEYEWKGWDAWVDVKE
ncbi:MULTISPECIES: hypothetical protein [Marinomonas]|nr:hypothetical protein [Marinomonas flavescens]